jgi:hypothetical protein
MANLSRGQLLFEEGPNNAQATRIVTNTFWRMPTWDDQSDVIGRVNISEREVGIPTMARFLGVRAKTRLTRAVRGPVFENRDIRAMVVSLHSANGRKL